MPQFKIEKATSSDMENYVENVEVQPLSLDSAGDQKETTYQSTNWTKYWGYFNAIPDLKSAILMKAIWNVGKGYTADTETQVLLEGIKGWGKSTFDDILFNMEIIKRVNGDSFAEIVRDPKTKTIINLKPLDPSTIKIVVDDLGIIKRYEQTSKIKGEKPIKFQPEEIFHLSNNQLASQIHGISDIESLQATIDAENTTFTDTNQIMHRQARPLVMFKIGTDDQTKINAFIKKMDTALNKGEAIYIPDDENSVSFEVVQINPSAMILAWREDIRNKFYRTIGLPQIVPGSSGGSTESESKVIYMAFENIVKKDQRYLEQQIWAQLYLKIKLVPPTSLMQDLQQDTAKDGTSGFQLQDVNAGAKI